MLWKVLFWLVASIMLIVAAIVIAIQLAPFIIGALVIWLGVKAYGPRPSTDLSTPKNVTPLDGGKHYR